ncbi:N-acetyl-beta-glucosaminyl-glycoprotein 4-beta-N-acetylgalactosaminyltransferase 1, partial [Silurus asotus]
MRFPLKKIRKQFKLLLLLVLLTFAIGFTYLHVIQGRAIKLHSSYGKDMERQTEGLGSGQKKPPHSSSSHPDDSNDSADEWKHGNELAETEQERYGKPEIQKLLSQKLLKLPWKPEYKGQANLHVFEDWCGSSVSQLRKNLHFPLYPHTRTTVKKLAVVPKWKNYGLRIFGFIHPYKDGLLQSSHAVNSDVKLHLAIQPTQCFLPLYLSAFILQSASVIEKNVCQAISEPIKSPFLMASRRYYFEILHKQDDKGSDHVEVGWRPFLPGLKYDVIDSAYISLYTDESSLKMNSVKHIPQTLASHTHTLQEVHGSHTHAADMLRPDPRDTFYKIPMMDQSRLKKVLPSCVYSPTYVVRDFPIARYQGLQFVYLSYVYPNDFTRLTHMERENKCFYRESPVYLEKFGFYKYMKMDEEDDDTPLFFPNPDDFLEEEEGVDLEEDSINSNHHPVRRTSNTSMSDQLSSASLSTISNHETPPDLKESTEEGEDAIIRIHAQRSLKWLQLNPVQQSNQITPLRLKNSQRSSLYTLASRIMSNQAHLEISKSSKSKINKPHPLKSTPKPPVEIFPGVFLYQTASGKKLVDFSSRWKFIKRHASWPKLDHKSLLQQLKRSSLLSPTVQQVKDFPSFSITDLLPSSSNLTGSDSSEKRQLVEIRSTKASEMVEESQQTDVTDLKEGGTSEYNYEDDEPRPGWTEEAINWQRTFSVNPVDFELLRSDWNDLRCNVSGNLQLAESEVLEVISQYVERINRYNGGIYSLLCIVNVEKRRDPARGSRYLVELELMEAGERVVRLSEYIYFLHQRSRHEEIVESREVVTPSSPAVPSKSPTGSSSSAQSRSSTSWRGHWPKPLLCLPIMLQWRHDVMVHIVVPVKNQARWVQQFISDMELLHRETKDDNFSIIIVDFESEDMDVEQALRESTVPRYEYLRREGNFERSSGLQMGVDTIADSHSIVFLCDLHIHFPMGILESIRKHCVEGRLAFAPIVMRLDCGSSPLEPDGYWEVNGFGLFGIYKSDFDKIGGMNTEEFKDRWGGEDWEFLDR